MSVAELTLLVFCVCTGLGAGVVMRGIGFLIDLLTKERG